MLFKLEQIGNAKELNAEGLEIAEEVCRQDIIFMGKLLAAKIVFALGNKDAYRQLYTMLKQTEDVSEIADLNYELFQLKIKNEELRIDGEKHRQKALELYQKLYEKTPKFEYKYLSRSFSVKLTKY